MVLLAGPGCGSDGGNGGGSGSSQGSGASTGTGSAGGTGGAGSGGASGGSSGGTPGAGGVTGGQPAVGGSNDGGSASGGEASGGAGSGGTAAGGSAGNGGMPTVSQDFQITVERADQIDSSAPTTVGIVTWQLAGATIEGARIEFGLDESYGMSAPVDLTEEDYRTLLLGMKPESTYHFRIVAETDSGTLSSEDQTIETGAAFALDAVSTFDVQNEEARERGFLVSSFWRGGSQTSIIFILDADGEVVWWYDTQMNGVARARMSADGKNMWMVEPANQGAPVRRVSLDTLDADTYTDTVGSHDLTPVSGSTMAYLDYGESDCDSIFQIEPDGTTTEVFESQEVAAGQCHGNALRYSKAEDVFTMSDVSTDVWVVSRAGEFQWGLADRVSGGVSSWGGRNHGHHLLEESFLILANNGAGSMESSAIEYDLSGNEIWRYDGGEYTANLGDVQRLPGGNTLVTYSNPGVIHEVTPEKELVLLIRTSAASFGYSLWRDSLYGEPSDVGL